jgi:hypothetical protein
MTPEIVNDELSDLITALIVGHKPLVSVEIGSGGGMGSTQAFLKGLAGQTGRLFCIEARRERFESLSAVVAKHPGVTPIHGSSVRVADYMSVEEVTDFYRGEGIANLTRYPLELVLSWREQEISYTVENAIRQNVLRELRDREGVPDLVLVDGSPFTGEAELELIYGAKVIILDDTIDIKNWTGHQALLRDKGYRLIQENKHLRNGYAAFERVN